MDGWCTKRLYCFQLLCFLFIVDVARSTSIYKIWQVDLTFYSGRKLQGFFNLILHHNTLSILQQRSKISSRGENNTRRCRAGFQFYLFYNLNNTPCVYKVFILFVPKFSTFKSFLLPIYYITVERSVTSV